MQGMMDSDPFSANATSQLSSVFKDAVSTEHSLQMTSQHAHSHSELLYHPRMLPHVLLGSDGELSVTKLRS
jgi:hypothetical protein